MSYENLLLYGAVIPSFGSGGDEAKGGGKHDETLSADNPEDYAKIREFYRKRGKRQ